MHSTNNQNLRIGITTDADIKEIIDQRRAQAELEAKLNENKKPSNNKDSTKTNTDETMTDDTAVIDARDSYVWQWCDINGKYINFPKHLSEQIEKLGINDILSFETKSFLKKICVA